MANSSPSFDLRRYGASLDGMLARHHDHAKLSTHVPLATFISSLIRKSPMLLERDAKRDARLRARGQSPSYDPNSESATLHEQIQREFKGPRLKNTHAYKDFLKRGPLLRELSYSLPAIEVFIDAPVKVDVMDMSNHSWRELGKDEYGPIGYSRIFYDPSSAMAAFDGETQSAAWWLLLDETQGDTRLLNALKSCPVAVHVNFEASTKWAKKAFFLHNRMGVKVTAALAMSMDSDNPFVTVVDAIIEELGLEASVSRTARQGTSDKPLTAFALVQFVQCLKWGLPGLQKQTPREVGDLDELRATAVEWAVDLETVLGTKLTDKEAVCSSPAGLAALGAVGHKVHFQEGAGPAMRRVMLNRLAQIDWSKGQHWVGIAGKPTRSAESITISGPKEVSSHIYSAITDQSTAGYAAISFRQSA